MSKTAMAIALVDEGMTPFTAAKQVGLTPNTLYVALKLRRERESKAQGLVNCPCCGSKVNPTQIQVKNHSVP